MSEDNKIRYITVETCYQCRYGNQSCDCGYLNWCCEAERPVDDMNTIPNWCPLDYVEVDE
jgi:hypothetical protein